jgi:ATP-dependent Clp protease ATP-binding subunit ClpC
MIPVDRFTKSAQEIPQRAAEIMRRYGNSQMDTEHVLLALIEQPHV